MKTWEERWFPSFYKEQLNSFPTCDRYIMSGLLMTISLATPGDDPHHLF